MKKITTLSELLDLMIRNRRLRLHIVRRIHKLFFYFYFGHYIQYEIASFQEEMFALTQNQDAETVVIAGFRDSGKSSIFSLSYPLWAILGEQKLKFILIVSKTHQKAQTLLQQIKYELETNKPLKDDLGPFTEERSGWNMTSLYIQRYGAKIMIASTEQSVRGLRHFNYRPQLIICDDLEDLESVKTQESREKLRDWISSDLLPAGSTTTRRFFIGTVLNEDSIIRTMQRLIESEKTNGVCKIYPIIDEDGKPLWPAKFPNQEAVERERRRCLTDDAWHREYLLKPLPPDRQLVFKDWLHRYEILPAEGFQYTIISVDPAVKESERADKTAMVVGKVYRIEGKTKIYILPNPVNERLQFPKITERIRKLAHLYMMHGKTAIAVESVNAQDYIVQYLNDKDCQVIGINPKGEKRERLAYISPLIFEGDILFPTRGCEELEIQLVGFGVEPHDDLVDALTLLVKYVLDEKPATPGIFEFYRKEYEQFKKNPQAPGSLATWKNLADRAGGF
ncbi:MAG TPA: hypothetical protein VJC20_00595 [Candidatus Paceibacterota bacterium]